MQCSATTLPAKGIAKNCLILIFATAVALAMETPSVSPACVSPATFVVTFCPPNTGGIAAGQS
jgi:hypothetical protein